MDRRSEAPLTAGVNALYVDAKAFRPQISPTSVGTSDQKAP